MVHYVPSEFGAWLLAMSSSANRSPVIDPLSTNEDFEEWFLTNGGYLHPHIELSSDSITGQCLRVKPESDISADTTIVSCPHKLALSWPSARKFHYPEVQLPPCSQHVATRFFLMKQRLLGPASPWWPYIKMLPQFFNTPLYYDSKDMAWIRGTNLGNGKKVREDDWHNEYDEAVRTLFPTGIDNKQKNLWTWELYLWAATVMTSRSFPGPAVFNQPEGHFPTYIDNAEGKAPVLILGLDLLNHNPSSRVAWLWNSAACTIKTDELLTGGSEVPNNYGPKSNEELIMGYGFSLPDNPADHFRIDFSPAIAAYIKTVKDRRSTQDQEPATLVREDMSIHWVRVRENVEFSPCFLEEFSIAIENPRERLEADANLHSNPSVLNAYPSRNKLHVICAVLMIIQKGQTSIRKHNRDLPEHPQNTKQVDAARYRQNQLHTLNYAFESLKSDLISLLSTGTDACQSFRILRLEDLLTETPEKLKKDIRSVLNAGLKTRDPRKIRERGGTDFAYTIWLCGLLMNHRQDIDKQEQAAASESTFDSQCSKWLRFLHQMYPPEEITLQRSDYDSNAGSNGDRATWFDPVRNSGAEGDGTAEVASTVASYLDAIRTCTERHPQSLYNDLEVTPGRLTWCYNVVRNEGVWVPNMQDGEEDDEWMLYLECGDT